MNKLESYYYECEQLAEHLGMILKEKKISISCAESCTGGLIASFITAISGSSGYFNQSFVTYSNEAKQLLVDVIDDTLNTYGAVSEQVAKEMAQGALARAKADIAISVTGIAGPSGGSVNKPVGMVCFGLAVENKNLENKKIEFCQNEPLESTNIATIAETEHFKGNRTDVRFQATRHALKILLREIEKIS